MGSFCKMFRNAKLKILSIKASIFHIISLDIPRIKFIDDMSSNTRAIITLNYRLTKVYISYQFGRFQLNWITLCIFLSFKPWFSACFKALMWTTYFSLSSILQISFLHLLIFSLLDKNGKSLLRLNNFFRYSTSTSRKYPISLFSSYFFMKPY